MPAALLLAATIAFEVTATLALRASDGFTKPVASIVVVVGYASSFYLLSLTLRQLDLSLVYAIWSGAGTALVAGIGMAFLGEPATGVKVASILLIITGVVGLNLGGAQ